MTQTEANLSLDNLNELKIVKVANESNPNDDVEEKPEATTIIIESLDGEMQGKENEIEDVKTNPKTTSQSTFVNIKSYLTKQAKQCEVIVSSPVLKRAKFTALIGLLVLYCVFFVAVLLIPSRKEKENYWCDADGILIVINSVAVMGLFYFKFLKVYMKSPVSKAFKPILKRIRIFRKRRYVQTGLYVAIVSILLSILVIDSVEDRSRLISAFGVFVFIGLGTIFSAFPKQIDYQQVICGIFIQIFFGLLILRWPIGKDVFQCTGDKISVFLNFTYVGSTFAFGNIITEMNSYVFSFLTMILFFGMFVSILFYYGILQWLIIKLGWLLEVTMGTTPCESMTAAANVFLGQSEAPLVVRPYLHLLTKSELHAIITGGYATIAGTILAAYISFGISPAHLISASVMSAPAALAMSKLFYPETEVSKTKSSALEILNVEEKSVLSAIMNGLSAAIPLIANITASIIGFLALISFSNAVFDWGCQLLDYEEGQCEIQGVLGFLLAPVAWLMGVPINDCYQVGRLLGTKFFVTEFIAYRDLMDLFKKGLISARSVVICTYALCGFSSIPSMGCALGAFKSLAPTRANDVAGLAFRALIAGNFACYITACIAGTLIQDSSSPLERFNGTET